MRISIYSKEKQLKILRNVSVGQQILVQVIKEEMLGKGARVTADVSLAGRFYGFTAIFRRHAYI